jgi:tetratricopeptide (TPR) repeat protein
LLEATMKRSILGLSISAFLFISFSLPILGQEAQVKTYEAFETIDEHNQLPLDPYPPFGLLTGYICYPYQFYGSKQFQVTPRKLRLLIAENEYLKIAMCPDYGGRLYYMYDKIRNREVIHRINTAAKFYNAGMGYQYVGGGLELNLPNAHSQTNARPRDCVARRNPDRSVSLIMSNTEKIGRIHWSVGFTLPPGEARVRQDVRIANESAVEARYLYWANCGIPLKDNTEYIYPENKGAMHGKYEVVFSWPTYEGANIALIKNLDEMLGLYMLEACEGFFGYFSHDDKAGMAHYADVNDVPGKKYWSWGWHETAQHTKFTHTDGQPYGEVQAGRIVIQEKFDRLAPMTSQTWTEFWYPVGDIGLFNGASENAAVRFEVSAKAENMAEATIRIQGNRIFQDVSFVIRKAGETIKILKERTLRPERPLTVSAEFLCPEDDLDRISLEVRQSDGQKIAEVWSKAQKPKPFDSYFVPEKKGAARAEDFTAEGVFAKAEALASDWFDHLPRQKKLLEESLRLDPGFSRAHSELGLMAFQAGQFDQALAHFNKALERIPDDGRTLYYKGLALRYLGRAEDAYYFLRHSGRFGYEAAERIAEAEMAIAYGELREADRHLERAVAANSSVLKGFILRTLVLNRLGRQKEARQMLDQARRLDPENAFVSCTRFVLDNTSSAPTSTRPSGDAIGKRYAQFSEEILEVVATLYSASLYKEADTALNLIESDSSIIRLYKTELEQLLNKKSQSKRGTSQNPDFAWRLEEYLILKNQLERNPQSGELYYHLGNFAYAHDLEDEGIALWEKAHALGYQDKVFLCSLYRAKRKLDAADERALAYLEEAFHLDPDDPYLFDDYVAEVKAKDGLEASIAVLEKNIDRFLNCFTTCGTLMGFYLRTGAYEKLEKFITRVDFTYYWRSSLGRNWVIMKLATGYKKLVEKRYDEALADFEAAARVPENLDKYYLLDFPSQARRLFYIGFCQSKLGNIEAARKSWQDALKIKRHVRFEASYNFTLMQTRYFQAFCLRGLGRHEEADVFVASIREFADSSALANATPESKKHLLTLAYLGQERNLDNFERIDTELGITTFADMATSVED